ncbi:MAG: BrnT family toxin [Phormidesmis sp.]
MSDKGSIEFEWDEAKNLANIRKHRIDFADVPKMFDEPMSIELDSRIGYGEDRWVGAGFLLSGIAVVVWTERLGKTIRIISARKANRYERKQFEKYLKN